jgi:hypothetical protein
VNQVLSNDKMNSEETISLRELSQILAAVGISSFQEEHILTIAKNLSTSPKILEESRSYELKNDFPCQNAKEAEKLWTTSSGEQSLRPKIEEFSTSISSRSFMYFRNQSSRRKGSAQHDEGEHRNYC